MTLRAAIYCRISQDRVGPADTSADRGLGVRRQEEDCRDYAERRGWTVADVFIDNDISAYVTSRRSKRRPEYERLLKAIRSGDVDALVVWHPDRLHRSPLELEHFIDLVERAGIQIATVTAGHYDLTTPSGRYVARSLGNSARMESEHKSERLKRKHVELAQNGRVSGGGRRPFGYEADRRTLREDEALEVRAAADRVLAGESVRSVAAEWNARGVPSVTGAPWSPTTVKRLLRSGRIAGLREHHGVIAAPAEWPPIIEPTQSARLRALLDDPRRGRAGQRAPRSYVLSGIVHCGSCGARMTSRPVMRKGHRYPRYACSSDRGGCGRVGIIAEPLEALVVEAVLQRLDSPALREAVRRQRRRKPAVREDRVRVLEVKLEELSGLWAAGSITKAEWMTARAVVEADLDNAKAAVVEATKESAGVTLAGRGGELRAAWPSLGLDKRRAIISAVIESVTIAQVTRADNRFDPGRVDVAWRV